MQAQHHLAAGCGAPGFNERQVPGRNLRLQGEIELAQALMLAPMAQTPALRGVAGKVGDCMGQIIARSDYRRHYLPGNRRTALASSARSTKTNEEGTSDQCTGTGGDLYRLLERDRS